MEFDKKTYKVARRDGAARNFERWPNLRETVIIYYTTPTANTWEGQIEAMRSWLKGRLAWMDGRFQP